MIELIAFPVVGVVLFIGGVLVGAHNAPSVDKAIVTIKAAEQSAQATINKIAQHKAS